MSWADPDCTCVLVRDEDGMADCVNGQCECPIHCLCETCGLNHRQKPSLDDVQVRHYEELREQVQAVRELYDVYRTAPASVCSQTDLLGEISRVLGVGGAPDFVGDWRCGMSKRRPHWDDDLIESVADAMENNAYHDEMVYATIAAVEDWQERKGEENLPLLMAMMNAESNKFRRRAARAEAAIQRVREVLDDKDGQLSDEDRVKGCTILVDIGSVRRALDGDA